MVNPHPYRHSVRSARRAISPTFDFTPNRIAAAVHKALLFGLAFGALTAVTLPIRAQTANTEVDASEKPPRSVKVTALPAITVQGDAAISTYPGGQVATGGRMGLLGNRHFMETPFSVIRYTEKFIEDQQAQDITGVIARTDPAVFSSGVGGQNLESYSIRGFASDIGDVTIGGLAGMAPYYRSSPEMFERIEVLKGPAALLNGMPPKGSVGGSVNLVPKRADDDPLTRLTTTYMSDSQFGGHLDLGRRFGQENSFGIRVNGLYRDGQSAVNNQKKEVQLGSLGLDWRGERARVWTDLYYSKEHVDGPTRGLTLAPGLALPKPPRPQTLLNPSWAFNDTEDSGAMIRGEFDANERLMVYAAMGASKTDFKSQSTSTAQVFNAAGDYRTNLGDVNDQVKRKSAEVGLRGKFQTGAVGHQVALNATYYKEDYSLNARRGVLAQDWITNIYRPQWGPRAGLFNAPPLNRTRTRLTSYGLADILSFARDRAQLTLGVRRQEVIKDSFNGMTGARMGKRYDESATTPAAALLLKASDRISVYANYIEGLSQGETAPATADNVGEVFAPYKTRQRELGVKLDLDGFAHTVSLFEIKRPSSVLDPVTNVFSCGGEQRNRGVEWGFFGAPLYSMRLMGGIAYIDPKMTQTAGGVNQGKQAAGLPKWQAKLGVEWEVPQRQGLTLTANATSVSRQYLSADNALSVAGHTVFDLGARFGTRVVGHPTTLRASVTNVTNKAYWAKPHYTHLGLGAPRTFLLSATMDF